jgi:hypothetical protein
MPKARPKTAGRARGDDILAFKRQKIAPHDFVLDALVPLAPTTRQMFGCLAVYVEDRIVVILRDRTDYPADNGVWLATTAEHHASLQREFPRMRSIRLFGQKITHWQVLPADAPDFEESTLRACELIRAQDPRIGKVPKRRLKARSRAKLPAARAKTTRRPAKSRR